MSPVKIYKTIKHDLCVNLSNLLILFETVFGLVLLGVLYFAADNAHYNKIYIFCNWVVFLFGIALASLAFKEFVDVKKGYFSIIIPVTVAERIISRLVLLILFYPLVMFIITCSAVVIGGALAGMLFDYNVINSGPVVTSFYKGIIPYLIVFPIFFFGSAYFNNLSLFKTILLISALLLSCYLVALIVWNIMFYGYVNPFSFKLDSHYMFSPSSLRMGFEMLKDLSSRILFVIQYLSGIMFIILTYFALRERQVK